MGKVVAQTEGIAESPDQNVAGCGADGEHVHVVLVGMFEQAFQNLGEKVEFVIS